MGTRRGFRMEDLVLDPQIRDWVVIPIVVMMLFITLLRHYVMSVVKSTPEATLQQVADTHLLSRSRFVEANGHWLPRSAFERRRQFFIAEGVGVFNVEREEVNALDALQNNPMMQNMMTSQMAVVVPQILTMGIVNYFFSGFVILRLPFPLTAPFKAMLQQGISLSDLNVAYVSSLSWYFLNLFGLRGIVDIILAGNNAADDSKLMRQQMGQGGANPGMPQDMAKLFAAEKSNLNLVAHDWKLASLPLVSESSSSSSSSSSSTKKSVGANISDPVDPPTSSQPTAARPKKLRRRFARRT